MLDNEDITETARGFAAVALGIVADKELLPWNAKIGENLNYQAATPTLNDASGAGNGIAVSRDAGCRASSNAGAGQRTR